MGMAKGRYGKVQPSQYHRTDELQYHRLGAPGAIPLKHLEIVHPEGQPQSREQ